MYLKGLELQGFKSFPDRIRLDFNKGITAVVGPNGSGKSNISDAVRWVLGEKSAKSLRGTKMEDIIFSGTADRRPMGFAEVTLIMDNSDKVLNLDFSEVSVTRKVYRTGESEYLINGKACRQRDILELFMDTGVGKEGYSIIGQGRIDEILSTKSEDRRNLFEEAAGIVKYKTRCNEAKNNLESTQANLVRVNDIISELETQVGPLEKQAEKTKKYLVLYEQLKGIQISIFVEDADKYEADIASFKEQEQSLASDIEQSRSEQSRLEDEKEKFRQRLAAINTEADTENERLAAKRTEAEKRASDIRLFGNDTAHIKERIELNKKDILANTNAAKENESAVITLNARLNSKKIELASKTEVYNKRRSEADKISASLSESEDKLNKYNEDMFAKLNKRNDLNARVSELNAVIKQYSENDKSVNEILSTYDGRLQQADAALAVHKQELERIELDGAVIADNINKFTAEKEKAAATIKEQTSKRGTLSKEINEKTSRLRVLTELKSDYEGYYGGVKAILKLRDTQGFTGIMGAVGEVISVPKELETAIEIALGGAVQNIIADTEENVKTAISYLKQHRLGRATFLPMSAVKGRTMGSDRYKVVNSRGVIGIAKELISYDSKYEGIMSSLLDRVIVVDNIDSGIQLARQTKYTYKIVTLEGDLFNAGGSMTGGSNNKKTAGMFSRQREINELQDELKTLTASKERLDNELKLAQEKAEDIDESLSEANDELRQIAVSKNEQTVNIQHCNDEIKSLKEQKQAQIERMEQISQNLEKAKLDADAFEKELAALDNEIEQLKETSASFSDQIKAHKENADKSNEEMILLNGEINRIKSECDSLIADIDRTNNDTVALSEKNKELETAITESLTKIAENEREKERLSDEAKRIELECEEITKKQQRLSEEKSRVTALSEEYERRIRSQISSVSALEGERVRISGKREQTEQRSRELYDRMFEDYEITYVAAKAYPPSPLKYDAKKKEESRLKSEIKQLGSVNVNAVEEYTQIKERYDTFIKQQFDIVDTEKKLKEIIDQLQSLMELQFKEQFKIISENFTRVFSEMFGGGKAALKLADDDDVLNCGIEIEAQPPGKALQNMMLLSGGEKAMTAISLLFAILEMKPSPFCILDEIEAALDDANVVRFAEYLRNFTDTTQFVVITHRPGTREVADMLYGVTQERGISKLFSTNLDEIIKEREASGDV